MVSLCFAALKSLFCEAMHAVPLQLSWIERPPPKKTGQRESAAVLRFCREFESGSIFASDATAAIFFAKQGEQLPVANSSRIC